MRVANDGYCPACMERKCCWILAFGAKNGADYNMASLLCLILSCSGLLSAIKDFGPLVVLFCLKKVISRFPVRIAFQTLCPLSALAIAASKRLNPDVDF